MNRAFDAFEDAVRRAKRTHRMNLLRIAFFDRWRMRFLAFVVLAEPTYWLVRWAWAGFPVVGR